MQQCADASDVVISPELLAALRAIAPPQRSRTFAYVLALIVTLAAGVALGHPALRGALVSEAARLISSVR